MTGAGAAALPWPPAGPAPDMAEWSRVPQLWLVQAPEAGAPLDVSVLDEGERGRAAALRRPADRALFAAAHTALRRLLGSCLDLPADRVPLTRLPCPGCGGPHGRPAVAGPSGEEVHFSLSRSGGLALLGLAGRPIGVDIERVPGARMAEDVAASLHPSEQAELAALPRARRPAAFARCWTRKEACLKATGAGISGTSLRTLRLGTGPLPAGFAGWELTDVRVPPGHAAACAVREEEPSGERDRSAP
ncbi:4'-phosphopantetheinyl transferase superfamily protein [Streptomyces sp. MCA2]|uniref:4'-phosphopantetheinyl transferase family protein n=1 Tax=Streptomyces sp. MCA2 TaxID=2944805 RepID=UPI0020228738|nr:4'-phosphopantetheinyl transferase superfamily protein [Streptomyces sp. MCA2]MCL7490461.1 4'-phosphopantetheinyl transferase superfamily protein [Streptomyces sp. MCA2]